MKLNNIKQVNNFLNVVNDCDGAIWLESKDGDRINLKSELSQYLAIAALINGCGDRLELFCSSPNDESKFYNLFSQEPSILRN